MWIEKTNLENDHHITEDSIEILDKAFSGQRILNLWKAENVNRRGSLFEGDILSYTVFFLFLLFFILGMLLLSINYFINTTVNIKQKLSSLLSTTAHLS